MGLKTMVSRIPLIRYIQDVKRGTEQQKERAENLRQAIAPVTANLEALYAKNHVHELVAETFSPRKST